MRTFNTCVLTLIAVFALAFASTAFAEVTITFDDIQAATAGSEFDEVSSWFVTDPDTGASTTVNFFVVDDLLNDVARPILVEEGLQMGVQAAFTPEDTPFGEVPGNGNDWMLGNGEGVSDHYGFVFTGSPVKNLSIDVIDFRSDGPVSEGTPGSDSVSLRTFDDSLSEYPTVSWLVPDPRPEDGNIVTLSSIEDDVWRAIVFSNPYRVDAGTALDNLTFTVIPEPGAGSLIGIALVLFGFIRRK